MLHIGEIIVIGAKKYKVVALDRQELPCLNCAIRYCYKNKGLDEVKANHFALSCVDLMPLHSRFEEVIVE